MWGRRGTTKPGTKWRNAHDDKKWANIIGLNDVIILETEEDVRLTFESDDILINADGVRSSVRNQKVGEASPLQYFSCIIC